MSERGGTTLVPAPRAGRAIVATRGASDPAIPVILEFQNPSSAIVNAPVPAIARGSIWIVAALVASLAAVAGLVSVDQLVTGKGIVVSRAPNVLLQPLEVSVVRSIDVTEGEAVKAGDVLATLDPTFAGSDASALDKQLASLDAEVARLKAEAAGTAFVAADESPEWQLQLAIFGHRREEFAFKMETYKQKLDVLDAAMQKAKADVAGYGERKDVAVKIETMRRTLEQKKVGSRLNTLVATDARAEMERARAGAEQSLDSAGRDRSALEAESREYVQAWKGDVSQKLTDAARKRNDVVENLNKAQLRRSMVTLRAPQDAIVQSVARVSVGSVLQSGQPFITLVPTAVGLEVEAAIPGAEAGYVHVGDAAAIKFDTFPFTQYGLAKGSLRILSPTSVSGQEELRNPTSALPVTSTAELFYKARIAIENVGLHDTPPGFRLVPGMPVTADIRVGKRTILSYFLGKLLPVAREAMHEP